MRTNLDEMTSNVSDGVVKLTEKDVPGQCIALLRITVCYSYKDGWSVEEYKNPEQNSFSGLSRITANDSCAVIFMKYGYIQYHSCSCYIYHVQNTSMGTVVHNTPEGWRDTVQNTTSTSSWMSLTFLKA